MPVSQTAIEQWIKAKFNQLIVLSLLCGTVAGSAVILAPRALAQNNNQNQQNGCVGSDCRQNSTLYICIANETDQQVWVNGQGTNNKNFIVQADPGRSYWYWFERPRNQNRDLTVFLNGDEHQAMFNWTGQNHQQLGGEQACFFNKWAIRENRRGQLILVDVGQG